MKNRAILFFTVASLGTLQAQDITAPYYIHNQGETGYMTQLSDVATKYTLRLRSHAANGTSFYFGQGNLGATQLLQSANSTGATAYTLSLNPFGGKVGIGIVAPISLLDVNGDATFREDVEIGSNNATNGNLKLELYAGKRLVTDGVSEIVQRAASTSGTSWGSARIVTSAPSNGTSVWKLQTSINNVLGDRLTIGSDGNASFAGSVGIGTSNPRGKLDISTVSSPLLSSVAVNYDEFIIEGGANVGMTILSQNSANGGIAFADEDSDFEGAVLYAHAHDRLDFWSSGERRMSINSLGNIGIGTTSPASTLHVSSSLSNAATIRLGRANNLPDDYLEVSTVGGGGRFTQTGGSIDFYTSTGTSASNNFSMRIAGNGNVGIGTTNPGTYKLAVEGKIGARSVKVTTASWADYVFAPTYHLMSLPETEAYIQENQHLPNIPSAAEVKANGFHLEEMDAKLLAKIEELTLYAIEQEKRIKELEKQNSKIAELEKKLNALGRITN